MVYFRVSRIDHTTTLMSELKPLKSYLCNAQVTTSMEKLTCETLSYDRNIRLPRRTYLQFTGHVGQKLCN